MSIKSQVTLKSIMAIEKITGTKLTLGKLIWSIRQSDDITQVDFAKKLNITKQHLCDIEHDRKFVSPKLAANYAEILGYSKDQFIRLSLQGIIDRDGLDVEVEIITHFARKKNVYNQSNFVR